MISAPDHLLSLEEWIALPEDNSRNYELQEGVLTANPKSHALHQWVVTRLMMELYHQIPPGWDVVGSVAVITDEQVRVAAEVVAPGTRMVDTVVKPIEYARAGIPFYWVIDLGDPVSLVAHHLAEDGRYQETPAATRIFETSEPFSLKVDLVGLSEGRNT